MTAETTSKIKKILFYIYLRSLGSQKKARKKLNRGNSYIATSQP